MAQYSHSLPKAATKGRVGREKRNERAIHGRGPSRAEDARKHEAHRPKNDVLCGRFTRCVHSKRKLTRSENSWRWKLAHRLPPSLSLLIVPLGVLVN